jgi:DNA-binding response OmpR family regulator
VALVFGALIVDESRHEVSSRGELVAMTPRQFSLLATLAAQPVLPTRTKEE